MTNAGDMARMVPGFDFFQGLLKNAGAGLPAMGQWVAPTLDPEEIEKRIRDLKTVQFWLEQNARLLGTTVQALEVQRMTLATLKTMNLPLADLAQSLKVKVPAAAEPAPAPAPEPAPEPEPEPDKTAAPAAAKSAKAPVPPSGAVDPMQWWGALTQQFTELATQAVKDSGSPAGHPLAGGVVKQSLDAASGLFKQAADASSKAMARQKSGAAKAAAKKPAAPKSSTAARKRPAAKAGGSKRAPSR